MSISGLTAVISIILHTHECVCVTLIPNINNPIQFAYSKMYAGENNVRHYVLLLPCIVYLPFDLTTL